MKQIRILGSSLGRRLAMISEILERQSKTNHDKSGKGNYGRLISNPCIGMVPGYLIGSFSQSDDAISDTNRDSKEF